MPHQAKKRVVVKQRVDTMTTDGEEEATGSEVDGMSTEDEEGVTESESSGEKAGSLGDTIEQRGTSCVVL